MIIDWDLKSGFGGAVPPDGTTRFSEEKPN
jgi:hypothetical protein